MSKYYDKNDEFYFPEWACSSYGGYEHDWLDCYECLKNYEKWIEEGWKQEPTIEEYENNK